MERIALIGYRGSGKTHVGELLAARLAWPFTDNDLHLEARAGKSIARIFAEDGEPAFRDLEAATLRENLNREPLVLATGGGAILREANRKLLMDSSFVVWLDADAVTCWARIQADAATLARRPNLTSLGGFDEVVRLIAERKPLYEATALLRVDASESPEAVADAILQSWHSRRTPESCG